MGNSRQDDMLLQSKSIYRGAAQSPKLQSSEPKGFEAKGLRLVVAIPEGSTCKRPETLRSEILNL